MKSSRTFVRRNGNLEIKKVVERQQDDMPTIENGRVTFASREDKAYLIYLGDLKTMFVDEASCAFLRSYIPGEFDGISILQGTDMSEITDVFVILGTPEDHVKSHLAPLGDTFRAVCFTVENGMPPIARVPLLPEQAEIIRQEAEKESE